MRRFLAASLVFVVAVLSLGLALSKPIPSRPGSQATFTQVCSTLSIPPGGEDAGAVGSEIWEIGYDQIFLVTPCNDLQFCFVGWKMTGAGSESSLSAMTYGINVEYPFGSNIFYPVTWSGAATIATSTGSNCIFSDKVHMQGGMFTGSIGLVVSQQGTAFTGSYNWNKTAAGKKLTGTSGSPPALNTTDRSAWVTAGNLAMPVLTVGIANQQAATQVYIGDSITVDQAHTRDGYNVAAYPRASDQSHAIVKFADTGDTLAAQAANYSRRAALLGKIPSGRVEVFINLGVNDLGQFISGSTALTGTGGTPGTYALGITGDGTLATGTYTVNAGGNLASIAITNGGKNYTTATFSFPSGGLSGAGATATIAPAAANLTTDMQTLVTTITNLGSKYDIYLMTLSPKANSSSGASAGTDEGSRGTFNGNIRSLAFTGQRGFYEWGGYAEAPNALDSGIWGAGKTTDGLHPKWSTVANLNSIIADFTTNGLLKNGILSHNDNMLMKRVSGFNVGADGAAHPRRRPVTARAGIRRRRPQTTPLRRISRHAPRDDQATAA